MPQDPDFSKYKSDKPAAPATPPATPAGDGTAAPDDFSTYKSASAATPSKGNSADGEQSNSDNWYGFKPILKTAGERAKQAWAGNIPLTGQDTATLQGVTNLAHSAVDAGKGLYNTFLRPPSMEEAQEAAPQGAMMPMAIVGNRMMKGVGQLAKGATEVPGAIRDINASPDPTYIYADAAGHMASDAAVQSLLAAGGAEATNRLSPYLNSNPAVRPVNVKTPGEVAPEMTRPQAYPVGPRATPIGPRSGLRLTGDIAPPDTSYAGIDELRAKLTSPEAQAVRGVTTPEEGFNNLARASQPPPDPLKNFMTSNPSALDRLPKAGPTALDRTLASNPSALGRLPAVSAEGGGAAPPVPVKGVSEPPAGGAGTKAPTGVAKVETPPAKPVAKPEPTPAPRSTGGRAVEHRMGEYASKFDEDNLAHQKIYNYTNDKLAEEANKAKIDGKTDWTERDISKGKGGGGKAAYVRGKLMDAASGGKGNVLGASNDVEAINKSLRQNKQAKAETRAAAREAEKPFDPFDEMAAYQPGHNVHKSDLPFNFKRKP